MNNTVYITDIVIAGILIIAAVSGYLTGLITKVARFLATIISCVAAYLVVQVVMESYKKQIMYPIVFLVVFIVIYIILHQAIKLLKLVDKIPVIGTVDRIGGAVVGILLYTLLMYILFSAFFKIVPASILKSWGYTKHAINKSLLLKYFVYPKKLRILINGI